MHLSLIELKHLHNMYFSINFKFNVYLLKSACCLGSKINAYYDHNFNTICHSNCDWIISNSSDSSRCDSCKQYRNSYLNGKLRMLRNRTEAQNVASYEASSHVSYRYLDTPGKLQRMKSLHLKVKKQAAEIRSFKEKLQHHLHGRGISVDEQAHEGFTQLMKTYSYQAINDKDDESFHSIFWKQQLQAASVKSRKGIRWHPLIVRWALYLHHRSSGAYETLRKSGVIQLPTSRTLRDYRHLSTSQPGFSVIADQQLLELIQQVRPSNLAKYVLIIMDEMYIKEGLVYNKATGALIGFSDLGGVIQQLDDYEQTLSTDVPHSRPIAKTMFVMMVRGIFCNINFPYAQFPVASAKAEDIFPLLWKTIGRLELNGLHVLGVTGDGASINRKLFRMHTQDKGKIIHKTVNVYSDEARDLLFFSDPPHLLKTIRNAVANPNRQLWVCCDITVILDSVYKCFKMFLLYRMQVKP